MRFKFCILSFINGFTNSLIILKRQFTLRISSFISLLFIVILLSSSLRLNVLISRKVPSVQMEPYEIMNRYRESNDLTKYKKILFWNEAYGGKTYDIGIGSDVFLRAGCPVWKCTTTDNRTTFKTEELDAVVFHQRSWKKRDIPNTRLPHQLYVYWLREAAAWRYVKTDQMADFFNFTMTYRWDSDAVHPYGWFEPVDKNKVPMKPTLFQLNELIAETHSNPINFAAGKSKMAVWFVSNCNSMSNRNEFTDRLRLFINVDVYGQCGHLKCPRSTEDDCRKMAERDYKFYLSLENALCADYVTEKFYAPMQRNIIPIVFDLHGHVEKLAPPHSYINAALFPSIRDLANYLNLLDSNDKLYNEYFWWKKHYVVRGEGMDITSAMCRLCEKLHQPAVYKIYNDMTEWWDTKANCQTLRFTPRVHNGVPLTKNDPHIWRAEPHLDKLY